LAGFGTERIEEEVAIQFPNATVSRLDVDTTRTKYGYQQIISDFQDGNIDILIGTQMVTKGLDFGRVSLVGILNADLLLKFPDFRATERGFQLMTQVAGRAGRRQKRGKVIIQTHDPEQWVIKKVIEGAYGEVFNAEVAERKNFGYPPFSRLILLTFRHRQLELLDYCVAQYFEGLKGFVPATYILGPEYPPVARIKNQFNKNIMLKIPPKMSLSVLKEKLRQYNDVFFGDKQFRSVRLILNVDPQ
jgi:primosomal protein N' (replication factor Y)